MHYDFHTGENNAINDFHQRVADQNIQSIESRQDEVRQAKNGFIGMLAGIIVGGVVGWLFLGPAENFNKEKNIPVIRRSLIPAKVLPNNPGGMEIDNQNREIYHIVDNLSSKNEEVNIIPVPETPKLVIENTISAPENIENLVDRIEEEGKLNTAQEDLFEKTNQNIKVANSELSAIKTNSSEKIIIPDKIKNIEVKLQNSINSKQETPAIEKKVEPSPKAVPSQTKPAKGTWYAQIIASSSRKTVDTLWQKLSQKHTFLKEYQHEIEEITAANGNTLYRLKVGVFKTRKDAEILSEKLKHNQISCIIKQN